MITDSSLYCSEESKFVYFPSRLLLRQKLFQSGELFLGGESKVVIFDCAVCGAGAVPLTHVVQGPTGHENLKLGGYSLFYKIPYRILLCICIDLK